MWQNAIDIFAIEILFSLFLYFDLHEATKFALEINFLFVFSWLTETRENKLKMS